METTRKTAKYYRDILNSGYLWKAIEVLPEIIKKFGHKRWSSSKGNDELSLHHYTEFEWNHRIDGFFITEKGVVCADIYWQGDSTDGNDSVEVSRLANGYVIRGEYEWMGDRTYCRHSDIRISREELENAIKALATYLSPEEIKARKEADRKADLSSKVFDYIDTKKKGLERWEMENFWNGRIAVQKVLEKSPSLLDLTFDQLKPIVEKVFNNNNKSSYSLRGGWYNGEIKYNLTF